MEDKFEKRYIYILAGAFMTMVLAFDFCVLFVKFPDTNRDIVMLLVGALNSGGLIPIVGYFFGSSSSSFTKNQTIKNLTESQ